VKLYEYQAKKVFQDAGIPVPREITVTEESAAAAAAREIGFPVIMKAQVLQGGRGKAGLVKAAHDEAAVEDIFGQFTARGVETVTVCEFVDFVKELYLSLTVDPLSGKVLIMGSSRGGVDIEALAATEPEAIFRETLDVRRQMPAFLARDLAYRLYEPAAPELAKIITRLYGVFRAKDAELAEINPLFITSRGTVVAGDAKLSIDDNASFRQETYIPGRDYYGSDAEFQAAREGIPYLQFDGDISLMCAGAGLTTAVYDLINYGGGSVANYLEFGGPNYRKARRAMELCLQNDSKVILIVTFGTIARADVMAQGVAEAIKELKPDRPVVVCIRGTNEEEAEKILRDAGLDPLYDTEEAVARAIELSRGGKK